MRFPITRSLSSIIGHRARTVSISRSVCAEGSWTARPSLRSELRKAQNAKSLQKLGHDKGAQGGAFGCGRCRIPSLGELARLGSNKRKRVIKAAPPELIRLAAGATLRCARKSNFTQRRGPSIHLRRGVFFLSRGSPEGQARGGRANKNRAEETFAIPARAAAQYVAFDGARISLCQSPLDMVRKKRTRQTTN